MDAVAAVEASAPPSEAPAGPASTQKPKISFDEWKKRTDAARQAEAAAPRGLPDTLKSVLVTSQSKQFSEWIRRKNTIESAVKVGS